MAKSIILVAKDPKKKRKEYGVVYPDGTIEWNQYCLDDTSSKMEIRALQKKVKEDYIIRCANLGTIPARALIFVTRTVTTSYSTPEVM